MTVKQTVRLFLAALVDTRRCATELRGGSCTAPHALVNHEGRRSWLAAPLRLQQQSISSGCALRSASSSAALRVVYPELGNTLPEF